MAAIVSSIESNYSRLTLGGRYRLLTNPVRGSHSLIFGAEDTRDGLGKLHRVAVKILCPDLQGPASARLVAKLEKFFALEARALRRARHDHIVRLISTGTAQDRTGCSFKYQVLEYMGGGTLEERCRRQRLTIEEAVDYLSQIVSAVTHVHRLGFIHRDLKPENFLLADDARMIKLADFGVARLADDNGAMTFVGAIVYAPPEHHPQLRNRSWDHLTPATDVYSLAKSLYRMVSGERPDDFNGQPLTDWPPAVSWEPWSQALIEVLYKATQDDPAERQQSAAEFFRDVREAIRSKVPKDLPSPSFEEVPHSSLPVQDSVSPGWSAKNVLISYTKQLPILSFIKGLFVLTVAVSLIVLFSQHRRVRDGLPHNDSSSAKDGPTLDAVAETRADLRGLMLAPFNDRDVNLREQAGVKKRIKCIINRNAQVKALGGLKEVGVTKERWFEIEVINPGQSDDNNCQAGTRGWAYGKALMVPSHESSK